MTRFDVIVLVALPLLTFYFLVIQFRRLRYRQLARKLSAQYVSEGLFKTGRIVGTSAGQEFVVEAFVRGFHGGRFFTSVSMPCSTGAIDLAADPPVTPGVHLSLRSAAIPLEQSRDAKIMEMLSGFASEVPSLRKGRFYIQSGSVKWETDGILANERQIEMVVPLIQRIAKAVETPPNG
jgi:hypothetical protein